MDTFSEAGEALLLAEQGHRQIAHEVADLARGLVGSLRTWLAAMPTSLPPTEVERDTSRLPIIG